MLVAPLDFRVKDGESTCPLWRMEIRDLARGFCAALFVALPLLYTAEMWTHGRNMPPWSLAIVLLATYAVNVGYCLFTGFRDGDGGIVGLFWDALVAMGLGLIASVITLFIIARYTLDTPPQLMLQLLALETVIGSIGASVAINQLGSRNSKSAEGWSSRYPDLRKILGTLLGGLLFAFNIAPTIEPRDIAFSITWWHAVLIVLFSLAVGWIMVSVARFVDRQGDSGVLRWPDVETATCYLVALLISAVLLWTFGYLDSGTRWPNAIPWLVVMGYATTLGGAAGRVIL